MHSKNLSPWNKETPVPAPLQAIPLHQQLHSNYAVPSIQESGDLFYMPALLAYSMNNIPNCFKKSEEMEAELSWKMPPSSTSWTWVDSHPSRMPSPSYSWMLPVHTSKCSIWLQMTQCALMSSLCKDPIC